MQKKQALKKFDYFLFFYIKILLQSQKINESLDFQRRQQLLESILSSDQKIKRVQSEKEIHFMRKRQWSQKKFELNKENLKTLKIMEKSVLNERLEKMSQHNLRTESLKFRH